MNREGGGRREKVRERGREGTGEGERRMGGKREKEGEDRDTSIL